MAEQRFDVMVVGSGAAGLYATLCLPASLRIALVTKDKLKTGASDWAQGGIAAAIAPTDSPEYHWRDTLEAGAGLCDPDAVRFLVEKAPEAIQSLLSLGVNFDHHGQDLALTLEAAHSQPRVLHAADTTGRAIVSTLTEQVLNRPNIEIFSQAVALSLDCHPETGICQGLSLLYQNRIQWFTTGAVLLATGGGGQVFVQTTNPEVSTGDGVSLAWRAGAQLRDLEFFQFHPTALSKEGAPHFLISEAVRGEGAFLRDRTGHRFAFDYHPKGELAPRDVVSRAIFQHLEKTESDPSQAKVYLDLSPIEPERIQRRFPNIIERCQSYGIDVFKEPIPVSPAAHYWMGGILTDLQCQTSIPGLYAIGETTSAGVHGANRLASNSLLECIVFAGQLSQIELLPVVSGKILQPVQIEMDWSDDYESLQKIREELPIVMWRCAGICRTQTGLENAIAQVQKWQTIFSHLSISQFVANLTPHQTINFTNSLSEEQLRFWAETRSLIDIADLILKSALFRQESRGGHYRLDYPHPDENWKAHTLIQGDRWWTVPC
jgi:L-aspartate oxidase